MGTRGPLPSRSDQRTRRNKTGEDGLEIKKGEATPTRWPQAGKDWEQPIKDLYYGARKSGMSAYYQQSDIQWLWLACQELNDYRNSSRRSAMQLQAALSMFSEGLGLTEGSRRRLKIELELPSEGDEVDEVAEKVVDMKSRLKQKKSA